MEKTYRSAVSPLANAASAAPCKQFRLPRVSFARRRRLLGREDQWMDYLRTERAERHADARLLANMRESLYNAKMSVSSGRIPW